MSHKTTDERVLGVIEACVRNNGTSEIPDLKPETLLEDLDFDSLDKLELLMGLEEEFGIDISEDRADDIHTIADVQQVVRALVQ